MNRYSLLAAVAVALVLPFQANATDPGQVYYANFDGVGGAWTTYPLLSSSPNSWRHGWPAIGPSRPYPEVNCWATAKTFSSGMISGGYYSHEYSAVMSPAINLSGSGSGWAVQINWDDYLNVPSGYAGIEVSNNNGLTWKEMYEATGNHTVTGSWRNGVMSRTLSPDFCTSGFRIRFRIDSYSGSYNDWQAFMFDNVAVSLVTATGSYDLSDAYLYDDEWIDYAGPQATDVNLVAKTYDDNLVSLMIPAGTTGQYTDGSPLDGGFYGPSYDDGYPSDYGIPNPDEVVDLVAYAVGDDYYPIEFDNPVRLQFNGQADKQVGWFDDDLFHPIETMLADDDGSLLATLGVDAGYLNVGDDLVVWTDHLCYFVMYVPEPTSCVILSLGSLALLRSYGRRRQPGRVKRTA